MKCLLQSLYGIEYMPAWEVVSLLVRFVMFVRFLMVCDMVCMIGIPNLTIEMPFSPHMLELKHPFDFSQATLIKPIHSKTSRRLLEFAIISKTNL